MFYRCMLNSRAEARVAEGCTHDGNHHLQERHSDQDNSYHPFLDLNWTQNDDLTSILFIYIIVTLLCGRGDLVHSIAKYKLITQWYLYTDPLAKDFYFHMKTYTL